MEKHRWPRISSFQERNVRYCWVLASVTSRRDGISRTHFCFLFWWFWEPKKCPRYDVIREPANMAETSKLCPHVLIQDLLEKLHLKMILFVQAIWLNHQPLRFVLAFKPNIAAEKRPFSLGWKPTPNWSHLRREVVFACVMCIHVFFVFQQPFSRPVFV